MESVVIYDSLFGGIYNNKKVLITGHTGFKGAWLALWLEKMGATVYGFSLPAGTQPSHFNLLNSATVHTEGDIRDQKSLNACFNAVQPDIVFHLAAQALVRESYDNPVDTYATNVMGTVNVLDACRRTQSVQAVVVVSSDKCYENKEWTWGYRENDPMGGYDPYSASKGCTELVTASYRNSFFNTATYGTEHSVLVGSARAGNVIGGGDWADDRLVPDIARAAAKHETVFIRNPLATRPWQHVLEPLSGYLTLGWRLLEQKKEYADGWNFGPSLDSNLTVDEVGTLAKKYWDSIALEYSSDPNQVHEANLLMLDCSKANKIMNWKPIWNISQTLDKTISWYKEFYESGKVNTASDLESYIVSAKSNNSIWA